MRRALKKRVINPRELVLLPSITIEAYIFSNFSFGTDRTNRMTVLYFSMILRTFNGASPGREERNMETTSRSISLARSARSLTDNWENSRGAKISSSSSDEEELEEEDEEEEDPPMKKI